MRRKKIIVDGRVLAAPVCGIGKFLFNALKAMGHHPNQWDIVVYTNTSLNPEYGELNSFDNITIIPSQAKIWRNGLLWFLLKFQLSVLKYSDAIIWGPAAQIPFFTKANCKTLITVHDLVHKDYKSTMSIKNRISNLLSTNRSIKKADVLWCVSQYTYNELINHYPSYKSRPYFIGSSIDYGFYKPLVLDNDEYRKIREKYGVSSSEKMLLFVGTIEPRKNIKFLLKLAPSLYKENIKIVIAGGIGWKTESLFDIIKSENFPKQAVHFAGRVSDNELRIMYNVADAFCMVSLNEGFGLPLLEAVACGCPIVFANNSGMKEVGTPIGRAVNGWEEEEWVKAIKEVCCNKDKPLNLPAQYQWNNIISQLNTISDNI